MNSKGPFFIIGTQRGGTTLLRLMLNQHSELGIPPESHFLLPILDRFSTQPLLNKAEQRQVLDMIKYEGRFETWQLGHARLDAIFANFPMAISLM